MQISSHQNPGPYRPKPYACDVGSLVNQLLPRSFTHAAKVCYGLDVLQFIYNCHQRLVQPEFEMSKLTNFADEVHNDLDDLEQMFGDLYERKRLLKEKGTEVAGRWDQYFADQTKALVAAENAINRISNVPLTPSSGASAPKAPETPKVIPPAGIPAGGTQSPA